MAPQAAHTQMLAESTVRVLVVGGGDAAVTVITGDKVRAESRGEQE